MILEYSLDENDHLTYQLYGASVSPGIIKRRKWTRTFLPIFFVILGAFSFFSSGMIFSSFFALFWALLWFFAYPSYERKRYVKHYKDWIKEHSSDIINRQAFLELEENGIYSKDSGSEFRANYSELTGIDEIPSHIFIRLKGGKSFVIPKGKISDIGLLTLKLKEVSVKHGIPYVEKPDWVWK